VEARDDGGSEDGGVAVVVDAGVEEWESGGAICEGLVRAEVIFRLVLNALV